MMEATVEDAARDTALDALVAAVEDRRAEGLSVTAACRAVGVSTSTYYRRRRVTQPGKALALAAEVPARDWPFGAATPRAPMFWDQAFAGELTDSFVRREFGAGGPKVRPGRALEALAGGRTAFATLHVRATRLAQRLQAGPLGAAGPVIVAVAAIAALGVAAGWMVSMAADPAAWISHPQALAAADPGYQP